MTDDKKKQDAREETQRQDEWGESQNPSGQKGGQSTYPQDQTTENTTDYGQDVVDIGQDDDMAATDDFLGSDSMNQDEEE